MSTAKTMSIEEAGAYYFGLGRGGSYLAAKRGDLPLIGNGKHKRVSVPAMERRLQEAGQEPKETSK
jgi:hypothetical protein